MTSVGENEGVCEECHHLFNTVTGELVKGWERVYWVTPPTRRTGDPDICGGCKESMIESLAKAVPCA